MEKSLVYLKSPIGSGGEASIYLVHSRPDLVAKIYHKSHDDYARKLAFMIANPPVDPLSTQGRVSIAWAVELIIDSGQVVGFLMPRLDLNKIKPIFHYYNPATRRKECPLFSYVYLLRTARNLARAFRSIHSKGYVIGDVNESNILVAEDSIVTLVDTDSLQVNDGKSVYRCTVGKPEYTPPELQGLSFRDVDRSFEHDLFGLGVLIFQLLMEGTHPFGGVFTGKGEVPELKDRIKAGHFPHGKRRVPYKPMPHALSFSILPLSLQELFLLCFEEGNQNPSLRPTADIWRDVLGEFEKNLTQCSINEQHHYSNHLSDCPWCERTAKLGGRDPFPPKQNLRNSSILINSIISEEVIDLGNGLTIQFVNIPAGSFMMGGNGHPREKPIHQVTLKAFKMSKYLITQEQYQTVMGNNPSRFKDWTYSQKFDKTCPVESVSWHDAVAFCAKLSNMIGQIVRLPSEAQWEYACRAGSTTEYSFGDNINQLDMYAWNSRNSNHTIHPVGKKLPNAWGLHDMHGNVYEWCEDSSHRTYKSAPNDGSAWLQGGYQNTRAIRGGSYAFWHDGTYINSYHSAYRRFFNISQSSSMIGFRIVIIEASSNTANTIYQQNVVVNNKSSSVTSSSFPFINTHAKISNLQFVDIPTGSFMMGSNEYVNENPVHTVTINAFKMSKYPITQKLYQQVMGYNPSYFKSSENRPVESVSWYEAVDFCQKLSAMIGEVVRLPSEAQWEYACRAGGTKQYCFGYQVSLLDEYAWYIENSNFQTHPVGEKLPNSWGLHDMHGNVLEWCEDVWHENYNGSPNDGSTWSQLGEQDKRIMRGGSWDANTRQCRSASRIALTAVTKYNSIGFRIII